MYWSLFWEDQFKGGLIRDSATNEDHVEFLLRNQKEIEERFEARDPGEDLSQYLRPIE